MSIATVSKLMGHYGSEALRTTLTNYYCPMDDADAEKVYQKFERKFENVDARLKINLLGIDSKSVNCDNYISQRKYQIGNSRRQESQF